GSHPAGADEPAQTIRLRDASSNAVVPGRSRTRTPGDASCMGMARVKKRIASRHVEADKAAITAQAACIALSVSRSVQDLWPAADGGRWGGFRARDTARGLHERHLSVAGARRRHRAVVLSGSANGLSARPAAALVAEPATIVAEETFPDHGRRSVRRGDGIV